MGKTYRDSDNGISVVRGARRGGMMDTRTKVARTGRPTNRQERQERQEFKRQSTGCYNQDE